jgi:hypothetical protein
MLKEVEIQWMEALPNMPAILVPKSCSTNGECFPLPLPMSTGFQHLASFSLYLPPHGLELIENSAFN